MNKSLSLYNLSLKKRVVILLLLPLLGLMYYATSVVIEKSIIYSEMNSVESLTEFSIKAGTLIHETQKERGRTAGFLGSKGKQFSVELTNQRNETDKRVSELKVFLNDFQANEYNNDFANQLNQTLILLDKLSIKRKEISDFDIPVSEAINYYTEINAGFLKLISSIPLLSKNAEVNAKASAYANFLKAKENAGIERAVLSNTFALGYFTDGMFVKFISLVNTQDNYINVFSGFASNNTLSFYEKKSTDNSFKEVLKMRKTAIDSVAGNSFGIEADYWFSTITKKINLLKEVEDYISNELLNETIYQKTSSLYLLWFNVVFSIIIIIIVVLLSVFIIKGILHQIGGEPLEVVKIAERIANGDLSMKRDASKELTGIYNSIYSMVDKLTEVITNINTSAHHISIAGNEISAASQTLSQGASEQAANIEQVSSSMEEMSANIQQNTENSKNTGEIASISSKKIQESNESTNVAVQAIKDIAQKINIISDIAFQTNILALNAAVEAARAGIHGKGFAVVAAEVRKLAERSKISAEEITKLSNNGVIVAEQAGKQLEAVVPEIIKTASLVQEISVASLEQDSGVNQINNAIQQLNNIAQQNASSSEQLASNSEELSAQGEQLLEMISFFTTKNNN